MSKKITGDDGKTYVQKKPFYKRWWFILFAIVVISAGIRSAGTSDSDSDSSSSSKEAKVSSSSQESSSSSEESSSSSESSVASSSSTPQSSSSSAKSSSTSVPREYKSALNSADTYANTMHMSKAGLYEQLTADAGEKFSPEAAQYAVDNVKTDWNKNALESAKSYQKMDMSPESIREQLTADAGEKFTQEQADYAVANLPQ